MSLLVSGLLSFLHAVPAAAVGPYEDAARVSAFARASQRNVVTGLITHSDNDDHGASYFRLAGDIAFKSKFLIQLEIPYVDLASDDELRAGFGDMRVRAKTRVWTRPGLGTYLFGGLRLGSGTADLFPYATQSTDWEVGVALVDTLGTRNESGEPKPLSSFSFWVHTSAVYVTRVPERIKTNDLHGNYATLGVGAAYPLSRVFEIEAGGLGLGFRSGEVREICYGQFVYHHSRSTFLFLTFQGELGRRTERASNYSAVIGMSVRY